MLTDGNAGAFSRIASAIIVLFYLVVASFSSVKDLFYTLAVCLLPLGCIWFPEALGDCVGMTGLDSITSPSPALLVRALGWVLLLLPLIAVPFVWLQSQP